MKATNSQLTTKTTFSLEQVASGLFQSITNNRMLGKLENACTVFFRKRKHRFTLSKNTAFFCRFHIEL